MSHRRTPGAGSLGIDDSRFEAMRQHLTSPGLVTQGNLESQGRDTQQGALLASRGGVTQLGTDPAEGEYGEYDADGDDDQLGDLGDTGHGHAGGLGGDSGGAPRDAGEAGPPGGAGDLPRPPYEPHPVAAQGRGEGGQDAGDAGGHDQPGHTSPQLKALAAAHGLSSPPGNEGVVTAARWMINRATVAFHNGDDTTATVLRDAVKAMVGELL